MRKNIIILYLNFIYLKILKKEPIQKHLVDAYQSFLDEMKLLEVHWKLQHKKFSLLR